MSAPSGDAQREVLASALDGVPAPVVQWDRMGRVTAWNRAAARLFGFSREEALGARIERFVGPAYREVLSNVWRNFGADGESSFLCDIITFAGESILTEWHGIPLTAPDGSMEGASASISVRRASAEFGTRGEDPLTLLAGGLAHEFMNVFAVILSYARFIEAGSEGDPRKGDAREIAKSASTGACLTRHLLGIAGLGSSYGPLDVSATLQAIPAAISYAMGGAREFTVSTPEETLHVDMDWAEFDRMLLDLTLTACRAAPNVELFHINAERLNEKTGSWVRVVVTPHPVQERTLGAELTCSDARRIAESAGGTFGARGTELFVELPCRDAAELTPSKRAEANSFQGEAERKQVVFVLEDQEGVREALVRVLELAGYEVRAADSVASARVALESGFVPDLILCDLSLRDGSSTSLLEWLRRERPVLYERAIVLTGGAITSADRSYLCDHSVRVLNKAVGPGPLLTALAEVRDQPRHEAGTQRRELQHSCGARLGAKGEPT